MPDAQANLGKYAVVSDLFGATLDLVLAARTTTGGVTTYYWKPVRPVFASKMAIPAADRTFTALKDPSVVILDGGVALGTTRSLSLSNTLAFPGASFRFRQRSTTGSILGTLRFLNVNLATPVAIVTGGSMEFVYDATDGWVQVT